MTYKQWLILIIIVLLFIINIYCNNIILDILSYVTVVPKYIAIVISVLFIIFPSFMENCDFNKFIPIK